MTDHIYRAANSLRTLAGLSNISNAGDPGYWREIARAAESLAGTTSAANAGIAGYMLRTAVALEGLEGTSGAEENRNYTGVLKRVVDALEVVSGVVVGSLEYRLEMAAAGFNVGPIAALALDLTAALDSRITFTRESSETYTTGANTLAVSGSNTPSFSSGLFLQPAATNRLLTGQYAGYMSQDLYEWGQSGGTATLDAIAAPDGSTTADLWTSSGVGLFASYIGGQIVTDLTGDITVSFYVKKGNQKNIAVDFYGGANDYSAAFDLDTVTYTGVPFGIATTSRSITSLANGWFRIVMTVAGAAAGTTKILIAPVVGVSFVTAIGDTAYFWGLQIEAGTTATEYAPVKNHLLYSEELDNAYFTKENITISANVAVAPDGKTTADKLVELAGLGNHEVYAPVSGASNASVDYTLSGYAKAAERRYVAMHLSQIGGTTNWATVVADLQTGTITQASQGAGSITLTASAITSVGNGWYRISVTARASSVGINQFGVSVTNSATPAIGDFGRTSYDSEAVGSGAYWWGLQLEHGTAPSPYYRTSATNKDRYDDLAIMTGTNFSGWWNAATDTIVVSATSPCSGTRIVWQADDGTTNNRITIWTSGTSVKATIVTGGATQADIVLGTVAANTAFKVALRVVANDISGSLNGASCVTDASATIPTVDRCRLGSDTTGNYLCGRISALTSYASGLPNATLQSLTT